MENLDLVLKLRTEIRKTLEALTKIVIDDKEALQYTEVIAKSNIQPYKSFPWKLAITIVPSQTKFTHMSIINGVITSKGSHIDYFRNMIKDEVLKVLKKYKKSESKYSATALPLSGVHPHPGNLKPFGL